MTTTARPAGAPRLVPIPPSTPPPPAVEDRVAVPAPEGWRARGGADTRWVLRSLRWTAPGRPATHPIVLVHGLGVGASMVEPVARHLAHRNQVHAVDLAGFGRSAKPSPVPTVAEHAAALGAWLHARDLGPAVVVGISVGTQVVADLAARHPEHVGLAILASPTVDDRRRSWPRQLVHWQREQMTQSLAMRRKQVVGYARAGVLRVVRTFSDFLQDRPEDKVAQVRAPVLVCWGTRDPLVTRSYARRLADRAPSGRLAVVAGAVHAMTNDDPINLARVIAGAIDGLDKED
jgi:2-hydroxy-6-oxonona-2,4-dienedioate hydrolase